MSRREAFDEMKKTLARQIAEAEVAADRAANEQMLLALFVFGLILAVLCFTL